MQRLTQRFDSGALLAPMQANNRQQLAELDSAELRPLQWNGPGDCDKFNELLAARNHEAQRLLAALSQLMGPENVWRLASVLERYSRHQDTSASPDRVGFPLDLRWPADRRLALAWLRFLLQMAHKALDTLQQQLSQAQPNRFNIGGGGGGALGDVRAWCGPRASLSAQQSRELRAPILEHQVATDGAPAGAKHVPAAGGLHEASARLEGRKQAAQLQRNSPTTSTTVSLPPRLAHGADWSVATGADQSAAAQCAAAAALGANEQRKDAQDQKECEQQEDPIRRALERITGRLGAQEARSSGAGSGPGAPLAGNERAADFRDIKIHTGGWGAEMRARQAEAGSSCASPGRNSSFEDLETSLGRGTPQSDHRAQVGGGGGGGGRPEACERAAPSERSINSELGSLRRAGAATELERRCPEATLGAWQQRRQKARSPRSHSSTRALATCCGAALEPGARTDGQHARGQDNDGNNNGALHSRQSDCFGPPGAISAPTPPPPLMQPHRHRHHNRQHGDTTGHHHQQRQSKSNGAVLASRATALAGANLQPPEPQQQQHRSARRTCRHRSGQTAAHDGKHCSRRYCCYCCCYCPSSSANPADCAALACSSTAGARISRSLSRPRDQRAQPNGESSARL